MRHLIGYWHNDACRHQVLIDVSSYPGDTEVPWFQSISQMRQVPRARTPHRRARPNWKEQPGMPDNWQGRSAWKE